MKKGHLVVVPVLALALAGCGGATPPPASATTSGAATAAKPPQPTSAPKPAFDAARIAAITGGKPETSDNVVKVSFPRDDIPVEVDGWAKMPAFMGLTSWAGFEPGEKSEAMVMGDLVLFEDEVNPVMSAALDGGLQVTALHNHFFYDKPHVYFMHIGGDGPLEQLAKGVKAVVDSQKNLRTRTGKPTEGFGGPALSGTNKIDGAKLDTVFGVKGQSKDGMYKAVMGRKTTAECGCTAGKAMGVNTWAAFGGTDESAVVDGDFAVSEQELQPVLKALRAGNINIVAIHSHMTGESPRILFLHYWGRGKAVDLAAVVKRAIDLTAWDKSTST